MKNQKYLLRRIILKMDLNFLLLPQNLFSKHPWRWTLIYKEESG